MISDKAVDQVISLLWGVAIGYGILIGISMLIVLMILYHIWSRRRF